MNVKNRVLHLLLLAGSFGGAVVRAGDSCNTQIEVFEPKVCALCKDEATETHPLEQITCGNKHSLHKKCADQWFAISNTCPKCKQQVKDKSTPTVTTDAIFLEEKQDSYFSKMVYNIQNEIEEKISSLTKLMHTLDSDLNQQIRTNEKSIRRLICLAQNVYNGGSYER